MQSTVSVSLKGFEVRRSMIILFAISVALANVQAFVIPGAASSSYARREFAGDIFQNTRTSKPFQSCSCASAGTTISLHASTAQESHTTGDRELSEFTKVSSLPRHGANKETDRILVKMEKAIQDLCNDSQSCELSSKVVTGENDDVEAEKVYSNSYVDLGKVDTVGFDYDYTLVTYNDELLELIYDMALKRLVKDFQYPEEMLESGMKFDPQFSVRGLAVDRENGWICHLSYTHKVALAYEGRQKVSRERLMKEYSGKRALTPSERKIRLKPLNDLFSMAECCLMADVVQFFNDSGIPFCPRNAVVDILGAIGATHISGDFHRLVAEHPGKYFEPRPHLKEVLQKLKDSGKRLIFVSNSPFWYVDAGMKYVMGEQWRDMWDACIVSAGKPRFYTESTRPFREVNKETGKLKFKRVERIDSGEVYSAGCLKELTKCLDWFSTEPSLSEKEAQFTEEGGGSRASPNILYIGDSLFADLVDAKREFGWTTAAVTPEVDYKFEIARKVQFENAQTIIDLLLYGLREIQNQLGPGSRTAQDLEVLDKLERLVSLWREEQNKLIGTPFGSVFRAKYQPSLFAHSLRRYCDLYMPNIEALRHYSPQHRFYPEDSRLLSHEVTTEYSCYDFQAMLE